MRYTDIISIREQIDGDPHRVRVECNECDSFWTTEEDEPLFDAMMIIAYHSGRTYHTDFTVGVDVLEPVTDVDVTITVGPTDT